MRKYKAYLYDGTNITVSYESKLVKASLIIFNCNIKSVISLFKKIMSDKSDCFVNEDIICKKNFDGTFTLRNPNWREKTTLLTFPEFQCLILKKKSDIKNIIFSIKRIKKIPIFPYNCMYNKLK